MLTDEEKLRIRAEEIYRDELRRALNGHQSPPGRLVRLTRFLNTSLGIWFLSTVIVGVATFFAAQWRVSREEQSVNAAQVARLDLEIATRLDRFANAVNGLVGFTAYADALAALNRPSDADPDGSAYPEYRGLALTSLIHELGARVPSEEKPPVMQILESARQLAALDAENFERRRHPNEGDDNAIDFERLRKVYNIVNRSFRQTRYPGTEIK
jgi:hypothetical protein